MSNVAVFSAQIAQYECWHLRLIFGLINIRDIAVKSYFEAQYHDDCMKATIELCLEKSRFNTCTF